MSVKQTSSQATSVTASPLLALIRPASSPFGEPVTAEAAPVPATAQFDWNPSSKKLQTRAPFKRQAFKNTRSRNTDGTRSKGKGPRSSARSAVSTEGISLFGKGSSTREHFLAARAAEQAEKEQPYIDPVLSLTYPGPNVPPLDASGADMDVDVAERIGTLHLEN